MAIRKKGRSSSRIPASVVTRAHTCAVLRGSVLLRTIVLVTRMTLDRCRALGFVVMSTHIGAESGQIAPVVLLPGDPLRARWIAETFLTDVECYSEVRGMYGFTGTWEGQRVSVQGSGMGQPSMAIYVNELLREYDVSTIIRVGSCGALSEDVAIRDLVLASARAPTPR